jgi:rhamnulokinase
MPARLNEQLRMAGHQAIENWPGNEPVFARVIFESLASRYASAIQSLEHMLGCKLNRIHILGGGSQNQLLSRLTAERTGMPVERGNVESSTIGNFAVQLATTATQSQPPSKNALHRWAQRLSQSSSVPHTV